MTKKAAGKPRRSASAALTAPGHPPSLQVGALCWRRAGSGALKVLLITSRDTGRWVIPKGWPMRRRTEPEAAAREAYEEAGVRGVVGPRGIGLFAYAKGLGKGRKLVCVVRVYALEVREMLRKYPETGQRRIKWFPLDKAARRVGEPDLATLIRDFDPLRAERTAVSAKGD
jgi:8-oxo-dGTP pyrophosphatase MutT (NUDIX family)